MGLSHLRSVVVDEQWHDAVLDLELPDLDAIGVGDLQSPRQDVAQQAEGLFWCVGRAS